MELTVKFDDYGNEISVSKGQSTLRSLSRVRSLVTKRPAAEKLLSDSTYVGGMLFKASSRR